MVRVLYNTYTSPLVNTYVSEPYDATATALDLVVTPWVTRGKIR
jgi:hypothetical protein